MNICVLNAQTFLISACVCPCAPQHEAQHDCLHSPEPAVPAGCFCAPGETASHNNALVRPGHKSAETWHGLWSALVLLVPPTCHGVEEEGISSLFKGCSSVKQLGALLVAAELTLSPGKPLTLLQ